MRSSGIAGIFSLLVLVTTSIVYYQELLVSNAPSWYQRERMYSNASKLKEEKYHAVNKTERPEYSNLIHTPTIVSEECRTILDGDNDGIKELRNRSDFPWRQVKNDSDIFELAKQCDVLKRMYRFPPYFSPNVTEEELDFPIAYSLLAHENVNQILILLSAIYREHNIHCIHVDKKSPPETYQAVVQAAKCFPNIFLSTVREDVIYAHISRLLADIACMKDLVQLPTVTYNWTYLINLCSQDFPSRTNLETVRQLKEFRGLNSIGGYTKISKAVKDRTSYIWKIKKQANMNAPSQRPSRTDKIHPPPPFNMTVVKNLAYNFYTRQFLQWVLFDGEIGPALLEWSKDTYSPDEHYWLMLHRYPNAPGGSKLASGYQLARRILWGFGSINPPCHGEWRHGICVIGAEDINLVSQTQALFINKFDVTLDSTGPTCLRQQLDERATVPSKARNEKNEDKVPKTPPESFFEK